MEWLEKTKFIFGIMASNGSVHWLLGKGYSGDIRKGAALYSRLHSNPYSVLGQIKE